MSELRVVATATAKPDSHDVVRQALTELTASSRAEEGCLSYELFESASAPGTFVTVQTWRTAADLETHLVTPAVEAAFVATEGHLIGPPGIHPLTPVH